MRWERAWSIVKKQLQLNSTGDAIDLTAAPGAARATKVGAAGCGGHELAGGLDVQDLDVQSMVSRVHAVERDFKVVILIIQTPGKKKKHCHRDEERGTSSQTRAPGGRETQARGSRSLLRERILTVPRMKDSFKRKKSKCVELSGSKLECVLYI